MFASVVNKFLKKKTITHEQVITVLYGSHSGNSTFIAKEAKKYLQKHDVTLRLINMSKYNFCELENERQVLVVVSTQGEGEPPESARRFYRALFSASAPRLDRLSFAVCGLGDSSYEHFCQTGKDMDRRLEELGATRFLERVDCDVEFHQAAADWLSNVLSSYQKGTKEVSEPIDLVVDDQRETFEASIREKYRLNEGSDSATYHVVLAVNHPGFSYEPGDSVSIVPQNPPALVDLVLRRLNLSSETTVTYQNETHLLKELLTNTFELTSLSKGVLTRYQLLVNHPRLEKLLNHADDLTAYLKDHDVADLFSDFPSHAEPGLLIPIFRKIQPRLYSIASSGNACPGEVHLTVKHICFSAHGRNREGACSGYLNQWLEVGAQVQIRVVPNEQFRVPKSATIPAIMIGAGTGVAPFRAFLQERSLQDQASKNWLFFGEKRQQYDFFYREDWSNWLSRNVLSRLDLAFSRDREDKIYVQHKVKQESVTFFEWLQEGAHVYICGSVAMGHEVRQAVVEVIQQQDNCSSEKATSYLQNLIDEDRWHVDVY